MPTAACYVVAGRAVIRWRWSAGDRGGDKIGAAYGIPQAQWSNYEFDHYLPLGIGGSNDLQNLWPQPIAEALQKDMVENTTFNQLKSGAITQAQAVAQIRAWLPR